MEKLLSRCLRLHEILNLLHEVHLADSQHDEDLGVGAHHTGDELNWSQ